LIRSPLIARMSGLSSINPASAPGEFVPTGEMDGPRTMNWPVLLLTVRTGPVGEAATAENAINELRMVAMVFTVL